MYIKFEKSWLNYFLENFETEVQNNDKFQWKMEISQNKVSQKN